MVFLNDDQRASLRSFAVAFTYMKNLRVEQPLFGANYIAGLAAAHPNGECPTSRSFFSKSEENERVSILAMAMMRPFSIMMMTMVVMMITVVIVPRIVAGGCSLVRI